MYYSRSDTGIFRHTANNPTARVLHCCGVPPHDCDNHHNVTVYFQSRARPKDKPSRAIFDPSNPYTRYKVNTGILLIAGSVSTRLPGSQLVPDVRLPLYTLEPHRLAHRLRSMYAQFTVVNRFPPNRLPH